MTNTNSHRETSSFDYDVLVVGAGPSGLTTAIALARAGVSTLLVEKHPGLSLFPKAVGLRPRTMEILRSWGLEEVVKSGAQPTVLCMEVRPLLAIPGSEVSMGLPTPAELELVSPSPIAVYPQDQLEALMLEELRQAGGQVEFSSALTRLEQDDAGVSAVLTAADGGSRPVRVRYLVGADGAHSTVRELLGIGCVTLGSEGNHLATLFKADLSRVVGEVPHALTMVVTPGLEGMLVPTGKSGRWIYDVEWHPETGESLAEWTPARIAQRIRAASGVDDLDLEVVRSFPWDFGAAVADRQRTGRAFLVGDAAHRTTPRGATGMNTGIADGHNLGWKLAWVVRGWAGDSLLDSYETERAGVGHANARASLQSELGASSASALAHDFGVVYSAGAVSGDHPLAGRRAPHAWVTVHGRSASTIDQFDARLTVLTGSGGAPWRTAAVRASGGAPLAVLSIGRELGDPTGELTTAYGLGADGCVLVRPDGYVGWAASQDSTPSDLVRAIETVTARLDALQPVG